MASAVVGALRILMSADTAEAEAAIAKLDKNTKALAKTMQRDLEPSQARINKLVHDFAGSQEIGNAIKYAKALEQIGGASTLTAKEQARANKALQEGLDKLKALGPEFQKLNPTLAKSIEQIKQFANETKQANPPTQQLGGGVDALIGKAKMMAGVFGVTLGAGALVGFAKGVFNAADQIGDLALKMGVSTDAAQRFQYAARQSGAEIEDVSQAIVKMNQNLATGDKSTVSALQAAGLNFQQIRSQRPEDAFRTIADAIGRIPDPMMQSRVAMELFGKSGAMILPMIREESLKAADGVTVMSEETIKRLKDAQQAWENFWNQITIISAEGISKMVADLKVGLTFLSRLLNPSAGGLSTALGLGQAEFNAARSKPMRDLQASMTAPGAMSSHGPTFLTKEEQDAIDKRNKKLTDDRIREEERYRKFEREKIQGISDVEKQRRADERRWLIERKLLTAEAWSRGLVSNQLSRILTQGQMLIPGAPSLFKGMQTIDFSKPMQLSQSQQAIMGVWTQMQAGAFPQAEQAQTLGGLFRGGVSGAFGNLPQTILQALTGGGNVGKSIGSLFGGQIGTNIIGTSTKGMFEGGLGKMLQGALGKNIGGAIASFIPGLGALLGPALGKVFSAIGNIGANTTKQGREDFAKRLGFEGLDNLYAKLKSLGSEGEKLANLGLNVIGKKDKAANEKWMKDVTAFFDRLEKVPGKVNELSNALTRFGGVLPTSLEPLLNSILASSNLSPDLRKQLEGMRKPSWQAAAELAQQFGVNPAALGAGFNQSRLAEQAFNLKRSLDLFGKFAGSDQNAILRDMADEFSDLAREAQRTGTALPKAVEAFIRQIAAMGLLVDENGNMIDAAVLTFADIEDEYQKEVVSLLEQIRDLLKPPAAGGGGGVPGVPGVPPILVPGGPIIDPGMPGFSGVSGSYGSMAASAATFGAEGAGGAINIYAIDAPSFETFLKQRGGAEAVVRAIPSVVSRWGHA